eukprot:13543856-Ditylum_brightwellii.AAC.1
MPTSLTTDSAETEVEEDEQDSSASLQLTPKKVDHHQKVNPRVVEQVTVISPKGKEVVTTNLTSHKKCNIDHKHCEVRTNYKEEHNGNCWNDGESSFGVVLAKCGCDF